MSHALIIVPNHPAFYPHVARHANALLTRFDQVTVLAVFAAKDVLPSLPRVTYVSAGEQVPQGPRGFLRWMRTVCSFVRKHDFTAVEAIDPPNLIPAALALALRKTRLVYFSMEIFPETPALATRPLKRNVWKLLEWLAVRRADAVLTVNCSVADYLQKSLAVKSINVVRSIPELRPSPVRTGELRALCGVDDSAMLFVYQGFLEPGRGLEPLAEALRLRPNIHFAIMGYGPLQAKLEHIASVQNNIHFCGAHPFVRLMELAADADAGVVWSEPLSASYRLSLPGKLFEYVQNGLPMLGSPMPEIQSHILQYKLGEVAKDFSLEATLQALDTLCVKISQNAYAHALTEAKNILCWEQEQVVLTHAFEE